MSDASLVPAQPAPGENWWREDPTLQALLEHTTEPAILEAARPRLDALGQAAPAEVDPQARLADRHRPTLHRRSPTGERIDEVEFHPSYREVQRLAREHRVFTAPWHPLGSAERAPRTISFALGYLYSQAEAGYYCPACMTDGAAFVLDRHAPDELRERYVPHLTSLSTDAPSSAEDAPLEGAMYLTEKAGGSDVGGATATVARQAEDGGWRLTGEKWFASNCVAGLALALARMPGTDASQGTRGLGLFAVPRHLPDGSPNPGVRIERLKDKLGVTSMPTGEIVLDDAVAYLVRGQEGGFKAMAEMVNLSRLYNAVTSVAIMRRALREGLRAGETRKAFGRELRNHPLFARKLVELTVDTEGALAFVMDTAEVFDAWADGDVDDDGDARPLLRALTPMAKAATAKLAVQAASEACELVGGNGYIEEYVTPRLLRDAQVLPIWEGTTNIQGLDLLRAQAKEEALVAFVAHVEATVGQAAGHSPVKRAVDRVRASLEDLVEQANKLQQASREEMELAALDLLFQAYHTHAAALLARLASQTESKRLARIAEVYAARHLEPDPRKAAEQVREATIEAGLEIAYPF